MGPNGQAQYWAPRPRRRLPRSCSSYYEHAYVAPGERFPRRAATTDPVRPRRRRAPHAAPGTDLATRRRVFSDATNPGRKKPFDIRSVMRAVIDADQPPLERWAGDARRRGRRRLGRAPRRLAGRDARASSRARCRATGRCPPTAPSSGRRARCSRCSSKKIARAINAAGGQPAAGRAGQPRRASTARRSRCASWQLEYGAEIGRAVVNFDGPIVVLRRLPLPRRRVRRLLAARSTRTSRRSRSRARTRR